MTGIDEIVWVPASAAERFAERIARLNDRARRLGSRSRVSIEETAREPRPVAVTRRTFRDGAFHVETTVEPVPSVVYRMACPEPRIALPGWSWAGWIAARGAEKDSVGGAVDAPVFHATPERPIAAATLDAAFDGRGRMRCDHCGTFRNRRMGFVVRDAGGSERVVGSSCLLDFVGHDPKAVLSFYRSLSLLRTEIDSERRADAFGAKVYDWAAHHAAESAAAAARDAVAHPLRRIVGATLKAMGDQGFYARTSGADRTATPDAVRALLEGGYAPGPAMAARADEIAAWARGRGAGFPEDPGTPVSIGEYLREDPGFRLVDDYRLAGYVPLGRAYADGEVAEVTYIGCEPADITVAAGLGTKLVERSRHLFGDAFGSRLVWETGSDGIDGLVPGARLRIRFRNKRSWTERMRLVSRVSNVRAA